MKPIKPATNSTITNDRFIKYPIISTVIGFFSLNSRLQAAQEELQRSAPGRQKAIENADKIIAASEARIKESDYLIAVSQASRQGVQ